MKSLRYKIIELSGQPVDPNAINNKGYVVGSHLSSKGATQAFLYADGTMKNLGVLSGFEHSVAYALNDHGVVVGACWKGAKSTAFVWEKGVMRALQMPSGHADDGQAHGINDNGSIVGWYGSTTAFLSQNGKTIELPQLSGGGDTTACDVNRAGVIVGASGRKAVVWENRKILVLDGVRNDASASAVNDRGDIIGWGSGRSFFIRDNKVTYIPGFRFGGAVVAQKINNRGDIVGRAQTWKGDGMWGRQWNAFLYRDGKMYDLNRHCSNLKFHLEWATGINDGGSIICHTRNDKGSGHAVILHPI